MEIKYTELQLLQTQERTENKEQENRSDDEIEGDFLIGGNTKHPKNQHPETQLHRAGRR